MNTTEAFNALRDLEATFEAGGAIDCAERLRAASNALAEALNQQGIPAAQPAETDPLQIALCNLANYFIADRDMIELGWDADHIQEACDAYDAAMLALGSIDTAQPVQRADECYCDANNIGEPNTSCGDCPKRDYKDTAQPVQRAAPIAGRRG